MVKFLTKGAVSSTDLFRVSFNTAFVANNNILKFGRYEISPEKVHKDFKMFPEGFEVQFEFEDFCKGQVNPVTDQVITPPCTSTTTDLDNICE